MTQEKNRAFAEAVLRGHPDKLADQIADAILDDYLKQDPNARVACEVIVKENGVFLAGEISSRARSLYTPFIRTLIEEVGYTDAAWGMDAKTCEIQSSITEQSPEIAHSVEEGAGDQSIVYGYATDETDLYLPLPYTLAQKLATDLSLNRPFPFLRPDGKVLCTTENHQIHSLALSVQHDESTPQDQMFQQLQEYAKDLLQPHISKQTHFYINTSGSFTVGGPLADTGVTGRKIMVDTYGTVAPHGGGAFSGKDASKIDRSGAYAARHLAKSIVAHGLASKCLVKLAYCIGVKNPIDFSIETTPHSNTSKLIAYAKEHFPLTLNEITNHFDLKNPIYQSLAFGGHFGRNVPWEQTAKIIA